MTINEGLRMLAGAFIILSVLFAHYFNEYWLLFTLFIGANLFQSAFTKWCPAMWVLNKVGFKQEKVVG